MVHLDNLHDLILIAFGAVLGANTRFIIYQKLEVLNLRKDFIILIINTFASFCLGFFLSFLRLASSLNFSFQLALFFSIGLIGSFSTFSTFIYDLYELFIHLKFYRAFKLFIISLASGILSFAIGIFVGMYKL